MASNKKGSILSKVPLPDTFFSIKHQLRPIASISVSAPSAILIYLLTIGGFVGCWWFYSLPNPPQTVTVIQSEWQKEGYECKPLQTDTVYGLMHTYDDCKAKLLPASTATLSLDNATQRWAYKPFADSGAGAVYPKLPSKMADVFAAIKTPAQLSDGSCFDGTTATKSLQLTFEIPATTETVQQASWYKEGYECKPLQTDSRYDSLFSYDECISVMNSFSIQTTVKKSKCHTGGMSCGPAAYADCDVWRYYPFNTTTLIIMINDDVSYVKSICDKTCFNCVGSNYLGNMEAAGCVNQFSDIEAQECWNKVKLSGIACEHLKDNSPFQCTKTTAKQVCIDKETAEKVFNALNDKHPICDHFKTNAPFQCTKTTVTYKSDLEKLSLSVANTQLLFGTLTALFATLFYKLKKDNKVMSQENSWQDAVKTLQQQIQEQKRQIDELKQNKVDKLEKV